MRLSSCKKGDVEILEIGGLKKLRSPYLQYLLIPFAYTKEGE